MKKFFLGLCLYISIIVVMAFGMVGIIHLSQIHNENIATLIFELCVPFAFIVALAIEGFLRY